jgi:hypothetical protein
LRHRGTEFDVEEGPPSWWHWIIYPGADEHVIALEDHYETALQDLLDKKQKGQPISKMAPQTSATFLRATRLRYRSSERSKTVTYLCQNSG